MKIIHVLRKPLGSSVASNILTHGCGGLNIDSTRIAYPSGKPESGWAKTGSDGTKGFQGTSTFRMRKRSPEEIQERTARGRWPANLILQHLPGCIALGLSSVPGIPGGNISGRNAFGQDSGWNRHQNKSTGIQRQPTEAVALWTCQENCPAIALDTQSGVLKSGDLKQHYVLHSAGGNGITHGKMEGIIGEEKAGDKGGASRFFKQVK